MDKILLCCVLILGETTLPAPPEDIYHMARAIDGERPDLVCSNLNSDECTQLADRIGQVVLNRHKKGWCNSIQSCVDGGFWGAADVGLPREWAILSAIRVLRTNRMTEDFFVFSAQDICKLGLEKGDANGYSENGQLGLYFYGHNALN